MTFFTLACPFVLAVGPHNLEEALLLPGWSQSADRCAYTNLNAALENF